MGVARKGDRGRSLALWRSVEELGLFLSSNGSGDWGEDSLGPQSPPLPECAPRRAPIHKPVAPRGAGKKTVRAMWRRFGGAPPATRAQARGLCWGRPAKAWGPKVGVPPDPLFPPLGIWKLSQKRGSEKSQTTIPWHSSIPKGLFPLIGAVVGRGRGPLEPRSRGQEWQASFPMDVYDDDDRGSPSRCVFQEGPKLTAAPPTHAAPAHSCARRFSYHGRTSLTRARTCPMGR